MFSNYHIPVLLEEVIGHLNINAGGVYVDCTFGSGGHSRAILKKLSDKGRVIAFDQDQDAQVNVPDDKRLLFIPHNFRHAARFLQLHGVSKVDGILADLGVSSHQLDKGSRGFSTRIDNALDMRMDQRQQKTAFDILNTYSELQLHKVFERYGEVTNSKTLAKIIVDIRKTVSLQTINGFKNGVSSVVKGNPAKYFAQVFQALRIEVNEELMALKELLEQVPELLKIGGRAVFITFHSLEDRLVKIFFRDGTFEEPVYNPFKMSSTFNPLKTLTKKPVAAGSEERKRNPRSRSAKLRVAEKIVDKTHINSASA